MEAPEDDEALDEEAAAGLLSVLVLVPESDDEPEEDEPAEEEPASEELEEPRLSVR